MQSEDGYEGKVDAKGEWMHSEGECRVRIESEDTCY